MTLVTKLLVSLGTLLIAHSVYSAHEHPSTTAIPADITLETLLASFLLITGIVTASSSELRLIALRTWSGQLERTSGSGPFSALEERTGFWDVRAARREWGVWAKGE